MREAINRHFEEHCRLLQQVATELAGEIAAAASLVGSRLAAGNKLLVLGNGGSAADAQHLAAELVGRYRCERQALAAIALTTDTSILTAVGNDYGFDNVFRRQVEALALPGDVVCGISTSGRSRNVLLALEAARQRGCRVVSLTGGDGGEMKALADVALVVPSNQTPYIQEAHLTIIHILCGLVEQSAQRSRPDSTPQ